LPFLVGFKQYVYFFIIFIILFLLNISYNYSKFNDFKAEPLIKFSGIVNNIYDKKEYKILKIKTDNLIFFTSISSKLNIKQNNIISGYLITKKITFLEYIKGFYGLTFSLNIKQNKTIINKIQEYIDKQHTSNNMQSLFNALFLAIPINNELRQVCSIYGISHLVAISGFHLSILSAIFFALFYIPYNFIHKKYFPYRNKKFDILILVSVTLGIYLVLTGYVPSLLRAFVMFVVGVFFARSNIKILSYETLFIVIMIILALFPSLIFSLSFWFSICGVFYIFLFLQYFKNLPKIWKLLFFNIWIYLAMNPIVHYFFDTTSIIQLLSPFFTLLFTFFYPLELLLHIFGYGGLLDGYLIQAMSLKFDIISKTTPNIIFYMYILLSIFSIKNKKVFIVLNAFIVCFTIWLYLL